MVAVICAGCSHGPPDAQRILIKSDCFVFDGADVTGSELRKAVRAKICKQGRFSVILIAPPACSYERILDTICRFSSEGLWNFRLLLSEEINQSVRFSPRPSDIFGPPVREISFFVSGNELIATTNSENVVTMLAKEPQMMESKVGVRVFFNATPETTAEQLQQRLSEWATLEAEIFLDAGIGSNQSLQ